MTNMLLVQNFIFLKNHLQIRQKWIINKEITTIVGDQIQAGQNGIDEISGCHYENINNVHLN